MWPAARIIFQTLPFSLSVILWSHFLSFVMTPVFHVLYQQDAFCILHIYSHPGMSTMQLHYIDAYVLKRLDVVQRLTFQI